jgi:transposase
METKWIKSQARSNAAMKLLMTVPGIGALSALLLVARLGDIGRFKRAEQVSRYFGLVPSESSSGDRRRLGRISKEGCRLVRSTLIQDAWQAVRSNYDLRLRYNQIARRRGKNVAIVAIARKLAEITFCVLRDQSPYDPARLATGSARGAFLPDCEVAPEIAAVQH